MEHSTGFVKDCTSFALSHGKPSKRTLWRKRDRDNEKSEINFVPRRASTFRSEQPSCSGEGVCIRRQRRPGRKVGPDRNDCAPFREPRAESHVVRHTLTQPVKPFRNFLAGEACKRLCALVDFNSRDDTLLIQDFDERVPFADF